MIKNGKNQCKKLYSISHSFKTAKIIVFDPLMCKSPDVPLQDEMLTRTSQLKTG